MADDKDRGAEAPPPEESSPSEGEDAAARPPGEESQLAAEADDGGRASGETEQATEPASPTHGVGRQSARATGTAWLIAVLVLVGFTIAVASAWYLTSKEVEGVRVQIRDTNARLKAALAEREKAQSQALAEMRSRVEEARAEAEELEAAIARLGQRVTEFNRANPAQLVLRELEYLLQLAEHRVRLEYDAEGALSALASAAARAEALPPDRYAALRAQIAADASALRSFTSASAEEVTNTLSRLLSRVDGLEMELPESSEEAHTPATTSERLQAGWREFVAALQENLGEFVEVRRADGSLVPTVIPDQEFFARENLRLALQSARLAALRRDTERFRLALEEARQWLGYFPAASPAVSGMLSELDGLSGLDLEPPLPDVSGSLSMVRELVNPAALLDPARAAPAAQGNDTDAALEAEPAAAAPEAEQ